MIFIKLALQSIKNRLFSTSLTVFSIAISIILLLSVERTRQAAEDGFTQSISQTDLLVGARTGPLNLILYTVFNMGNASNNITWDSYQHFIKHPAVDWTIPYSLGDSHHGFRVVATDQNFYEHYRFRGDHSVQFKEGKPALDMWDAVIGSEVARSLGYKIGDKIILTHGVTHGEGFEQHADKPFHVVGILQPTGTVIDQSVYISLYGMEAIHIDWQNGAAPNEKTAIPPDQILKEKIKIGQITAFFLRTKSRISTLSLQREINTYSEEPLLAIIPGATLADLWHNLGTIEQVLKLISWMVVVVGLTAMLSTLLAGLNERRREMAILRSLGAGASKIMLLLVSESLLLVLIGVALGIVVQLVAFSLVTHWLEVEFGLYITGQIWSPTILSYIGLTVFLGAIVGLIPAVRASRTALKDGLSVRL